MNLRTLENDAILDGGALLTDVRRFAADTSRLLRDLVSDSKAEAKHIADPSQRESIVERHFGLIALGLAMFLVVYFSVIAYILALPGPQ